MADLPFGRNRHFASNVSKGLDAVIGGWQLSGLVRLTSGFPFSIFNGAQWPTDWDLGGNAYLTGNVKTGSFHDPTDPGVVSAFSTLSNAQSQFVEPLPGQAGQRNNLRGDGYFSTDLGLSKRWLMPWSEHHSIQLRWEVFNVRTPCVSTRKHQFRDRFVRLDVRPIHTLVHQPARNAVALRYQF